MCWVYRFRKLRFQGPDRAETVLLWIQRLIIEANNRNLFEVPAPILSRAFQELSRGMVGVTDVRKVRMAPWQCEVVRCRPRCPSHSPIRSCLTSE